MGNKNSICISFNIISASRMRDETYGFKEEDVQNIDKIIEALHELVFVRFRSSLIFQYTWQYR